MIFTDSQKNVLNVKRACHSYLWLAWPCVTQKTTGQPEERLVNIKRAKINLFLGELLRKELSKYIEMVFGTYKAKIYSS